MYLGDSFSEKLIKRNPKFNLNFVKSKNIEKEIAVLLAKKNNAHFSNGMEFGPRALGNRSILCSAADTSINDTLNKRLHRTGLCHLHQF